MYLCAIATGSLILAGIAAGGFASGCDGAGFVGAVGGALAGDVDVVSFAADGCVAAAPALLVPLALASAEEFGCAAPTAGLAT